MCAHRTNKYYPKYFYKVTFSWLFVGVNETVEEGGCCFEEFGAVERAGDRDGVPEPEPGWWDGGRDDAPDDGENWRF